MSQVEEPTPLADLLPMRLPSQQPGVTLTCSVPNPIGDGVRDLSFLLRGPQPGDLSRWYDTYSGPQGHNVPIWYALHLPSPTTLSTLFFMHGPVFVVGGWWTELYVEFLDNHGEWQPVDDLTITPPYDLSPERGARKPFEAFMLSFAPVHTAGIRMIGMGSGEVQTTTLAYLAVGAPTPREAADYLAAMGLPPPRLFSLFSPSQLWDLIDSLREVTGIALDVQLAEGLGLDHFLDAERFVRFHRHQQAMYRPDSLYTTLGAAEGWQEFGATIRANRDAAIASLRPALREHHGGMVWLAIPIVAGDQALATFENRNLIARDRLDQAWHAAYAARHELDPASYRALLATVDVFSVERLDAVVRLVGQLAELSRQQIDQGVQVAELRTTVEELSTPILPVWPGVLAVPLVGRLDELRTHLLASNLLERVSLSRARLVVLDVTGVQLIDEAVAADMVSLIQATRLLGARCAISGIRPEVADALVSTGASLRDVPTFPTLEQALAVAIGR